MHANLSWKREALHLLQFTNIINIITGRSNFSRKGQLPFVKNTALGRFIWFLWHVRWTWCLTRYIKRLYKRDELFRLCCLSSCGRRGKEETNLPPTYKKWSAIGCHQAEWQSGWELTNEVETPRKLYAAVLLHYLLYFPVELMHSKYECGLRFRSNFSIWQHAFWYHHKSVLLGKFLPNSVSSIS